MKYIVTVSALRIRISSSDGEVLLDEPAAVSLLYDPVRGQTKVVAVGKAAVATNARTISDDSFPSGQWVDVRDVDPEQASWLSVSDGHRRDTNIVRSTIWECARIWPFRADHFGDNAKWLILFFCNSVDLAQRPGMFSRMLRAEYVLVVEGGIGPIARDTVVEALLDCSGEGRVEENGRVVTRSAPLKPSKQSFLIRLLLLAYLILAVYWQLWGHFATPRARMLHGGLAMFALLPFVAEAFQRKGGR